MEELMKGRSPQRVHGGRIGPGTEKTAGPRGTGGLNKAQPKIASNTGLVCPPGYIT